MHPLLSNNPILKSNFNNPNKRWFAYYVNIPMSKRRYVYLSTKLSSHCNTYLNKYIILWYVRLLNNWMQRVDYPLWSMPLECPIFIQVINHYSPIVHMRSIYPYYYHTYFQSLFLSGIGKGYPIGAAYASKSVLYPHLGNRSIHLYRIKTMILHLRSIYLASFVWFPSI